MLYIRITFSRFIGKRQFLSLFALQLLLVITADYRACIACQGLACQGFRLSCLRRHDVDRPSEVGGDDAALADAGVGQDGVDAVVHLAAPAGDASEK